MSSLSFLNILCILSLLISYVYLAGRRGSVTWLDLNVDVGSKEFGEVIHNWH